MDPNIVPYIAAVAGVVALFLPGLSKKEETATATSQPFFALALVAGLCSLAGWKFEGSNPGAFAGGVGFAVGALIAAVANVLSGRGRFNVEAVSLGLALLGVSGSRFLGSTAIYGLIAGVGLSAWVLSLAGEGWANSAAIYAAAIGIANEMGARRTGEFMPYVGTLLGIVSVVAMLVSLPLLGRPVRPLGFAIVWSLGAWVVTNRLLSLSDLWMLCAGGALMGLVLAWFLGDEEEVSPLRIGMGAVIGLAAATVAFSWYQALGMSVVWIAATAVAVSLGRKKVLVVLGLLAAVTIYRLFRETYPDASRAFDIGQHYALIGLLLGGIAPLLAIDWGRSEQSRTILAAFWAVILIGLAPLSAILFGAKGEAGYLIGLGLSPVIDGLRGGRSSAAMSISLGLSSLVLLSYGWLQPFLDVTRDEKILALVWIIGVLIAAGFIITILSVRRQKAEPSKT